MWAKIFLAVVFIIFAIIIVLMVIDMVDDAEGTTNDIKDYYNRVEDIG